MNYYNVSPHVITPLKNSDKAIIMSEYNKKLYRLGKFYNYKINDKIISAKMTGVTYFGRLQTYDKKWTNL